MHVYFEKFTDRARKVLQLANEEARRRRYPLVGKIHILWGILQEADNIGFQILKNLKVNTDDLKTSVESKIGYMGYEDHGTLVPYSEDGRKCLLRSIEAVLAIKGRFLGCQHLLLGLLASTSASEDDVVSKMLKEQGVTTELVQKEISDIVA